MPDHPPSGAVIFVEDLERVTRFYQTLLAMTAVVADDRHVVLQSADCHLVIHAIPPFLGGPAASTPAPRREDAAVKLFFPVASLADIRARAVALGGLVDPKETEWEARGFRACDGQDPEGNVVQFRENA